MNIPRILLLSLICVLAACSEDKPPPPTAAAAQPAPAAPNKTVFDTQLKALQKAKDVQKTVDKQNADAEKKLEDAGG